MCSTALLEEFSSVTLDAVTSALGGVEKAQHVLEKSLGPVTRRVKSSAALRPRHDFLPA